MEKYPGNIEKFREEHRIVRKCSPDIQPEKGQRCPGISAAGALKPSNKAKHTGNANALIGKNIKNSHQDSCAKCGKQQVTQAAENFETIHFDITSLRYCSG